MLKSLCSKIVDCFSSLFKSQKSEYKEKMIELEDRVQKSKIDKTRISIYKNKKESNKNLFDRQKVQITADSNRKDSSNEIQEIRKQKLKSQIFDKKIPNNQDQFIPKKSNKNELFRNHSIQSASPKFQMNKQVQLAKLNKKLSQKNSSSIQKQRASNNSEDSFYTLQSGSGSMHSISRRTFKSIKSLTSSKNQQLNSVSQGSKFRGRRNSIRNKFAKSFDDEQFKSIKNRQPSNSGIYLQFTAGNYKGMGANKLSQVMIQWNDKEYRQISTSDSYTQWKNTQTQLSQIIKSKLSSNMYIDEYINKLQDYYTFYFEEQNEQEEKSSLMTNSAVNSRNKQYCKQQTDMIKTKKNKKSINQYFGEDKGFHFNYSINLKCSYHMLPNNFACEDFSASNKLTNNNISMKSIQFYSDTSSPLNFLKWYNSTNIRSKLFDFHKITLQQNGIFPVLEVQQYSTFYEQKNIYKIVRQIQVGIFENDQSDFPKKANSDKKVINESKNEYILQLQMSLQDNDTSKNNIERKYVSYNKPWRNILRFQISQRGLVQIYYESAEEIMTKNRGEYYRNKWIQFQQKLIHDKMIKSGFTSVWS